MDDPGRKRFGRYEILSELGRGAMGVVYKAHDPKINRTVAVKTISLAGQEPTEEQEYRERFVREAEAAGRLLHPGIVTIFDVGEEPETRAPYIVMEFVGGETLEKVLSRGDRKLPVDKALQLALELAEALECAHGQGVVHRDLKPANILMTEDGHAKIADFGVAKLNLSNHTLAGRALGTPAYMSPEQLNGDPVDGRSDLFSVGVILYTVLTGYRPFQGNSALTVSFRVVNREPIPATLLDTELPEGLDAIITRAMAKDPAERYQRGSELVHDIRRLRETQRPSDNHEHLAPMTGAEAGKKGRPVNLGGTQKVAFQASVPAARPNPAKQISAKPQPVASVHTPALKAVHNPLEKIRNRSVVAVLLLAGLFILGLWVISFGSREVRSGAAAPSPRVEQVAPVKADVAPQVPAGVSPEPKASAPASVKHAAKAVTKELPKASPPPQRASVASAKIARAPMPTLVPIVSRAVSPPAAPATLEIEIDHKFAEAHLTIWVDDSLTYTHTLEGTDKKRLGVFHHVQGHEFHAMQISPGKHGLKVQVTADSPAYDQSATVSGNFVTEQENVLHITFNKHGEMTLGLQ
jgi:serine/threonine protein kinase